MFDVAMKIFSFIKTKQKIPIMALPSTPLLRNLLIWMSHVKWFQGCKKLKAQGIGVHKPEEIEEFGKHDLKVLSELLADKPFFFGDEPTTVSFIFVVFFYFISIHFILNGLH